MAYGDSVTYDYFGQMARLMIDAQLAQYWVDRWDRQQERYMADREERFTVVADVLRALTPVSPIVVDLGCGPGSMCHRLATALPGATFVGVDTDQLLLELGRARYPELSLVEADLAEPQWPAQAGLPEYIDAAVSSTALHWMATQDLARLYDTVADLLRPGGVFVNADHLKSGSPLLDTLSRRIRDARATRVGVDGNEEWRPWWDAVLADERLGSLVQGRAQPPTSNGPNGLSVDDHSEYLRKSGFSEVGTVWQSGDDYVLVGIR